MTPDTENGGILPSLSPLAGQDIRRPLKPKKNRQATNWLPSVIYRPNAVNYGENGHSEQKSVAGLLVKSHPIYQELDCNPNKGY